MSIEVLATFQNVQKHKCWNAWTQENSGAVNTVGPQCGSWATGPPASLYTITQSSLYPASNGQPSLNPPYVHISNPLLQTNQHINHVSLSKIQRQLPVENNAHWTNQWSDLKLSLNTLNNPQLLIVFKNLLNKLPPAIKNRTNCVQP